MALGIIIRGMVRNSVGKIVGGNGRRFEKGK
jgi:hypothetical protein